MADADVLSVDLSLNSDETITGLSARQIATKIDDLSRENQNVRIEIDLYEDYLKKAGHAGHDCPAHLHYNFQPQSSNDGSSHSSIGHRSSTGEQPCGLGIPVNPITLPPGPPSKASRRMSKSRSSYSDRSTKLSLDRKIFILQKECDDLAREKKAFEVQSAQLLDGLHAVLKEARLSLDDLKREEYEFNSEVLPLLKPDCISNQCNSAKKIMRFLHENLKARSTQTANLRMEGSSLRAHLQKLKKEVKQREELGDSVSSVDFEQIEVENHKFARLIEEKFLETSRLKLVSNASSQNLNAAKQRLTEAISEFAQVRSDLKSRGHMMEKINREVSQVSMDKERLQTENSRLKRLSEQFEVPGILRYMEEKKELLELKNKHRAWKRKVEIAEMMLDNQRLKSNRGRTKKLISTNVNKENRQQSKTVDLKRQSARFDATVLNRNFQSDCCQPAQESKRHFLRRFHSTEHVRDQVKCEPPSEIKGRESDNNDDGDDNDNTIINDDDDGGDDDGFNVGTVRGDKFLEGNDGIKIIEGDSIVNEHETFHDDRREVNDMTTGAEVFGDDDVGDDVTINLSDDDDEHA